MRAGRQGYCITDPLITGGAEPGDRPRRQPVAQFTAGSGAALAGMRRSARQGAAVHYTAGLVHPPPAHYTENTGQAAQERW